MNQTLRVCEREEMGEGGREFRGRESEQRERGRVDQRKEVRDGDTVEGMFRDGRKWKLV